MMRRVLGSFALLLIAGCRIHRAYQQDRPPVIMIFADVTVKDDEPQAVKRAIYDIVDRAPENSTFLMYPVEANMDYVDTFSRESIAFRHDNGVAAIKADGEKRKELANRAIASLETIAKTIPSNLPESCLARTLQRAARDIARVENRPVDVVLITDMVEECNNSIGGGRVMLNHVHIESDIAAAKKEAGTFADLHGAAVYFIYPPGKKSGVNVEQHRADSNELQAFWSAILSHSNLKGSPQFLAGTSVYHENWKSTAQRVTDATPDEQ